MTIRNINRGTVKKGVSPIVNVRISDGHIEQLRRAADLSGMPLATFIRAAAVSRARELVGNTEIVSNGAPVANQDGSGETLAQGQPV